MARKGMIEVQGVAQEIQGGGFFQVLLDEEFGSRQIRAKLSGRLKRFKIRVLPGDRVKVEVSPSDPSLGFIVYRIG